MGKCAMMIEHVKVLDHSRGDLTFDSHGGPGMSANPWGPDSSAVPIHQTGGSVHDLGHLVVTHLLVNKMMGTNRYKDTSNVRLVDNVLLNTLCSQHEDKDQNGTLDCPSMDVSHSNSQNTNPGHMSLLNPIKKAGTEKACAHSVRENARHRLKCQGPDFCHLHLGLMSQVIHLFARMTLGGTNT